MTHTSDKGMPTESNLRCYTKTLLSCGIVTLLTVPAGCGFMLIFPALIFPFWAFYSLIMIYWKPERRKRQGIKLAIWIITLMSIACLHLYQEDAIRRDADHVGLQIKHFREEHHRYPSSLSEIGISEDAYKGHIGYFNEEGREPYFFYRSVWIMFDTYDYDFSTNTWKFRPD